MNPSAMRKLLAVATTLIAGCIGDESGVAGVNDAPTAMLDSPIGAVSINPGDSVDFTSSCTDNTGDPGEENSPYAFCWDFDNDQGTCESTSQNPTYQFNTEGSFVVTVRCQDSGSPQLWSPWAGGATIDVVTGPPPPGNTAPVVAASATNDNHYRWRCSSQGGGNCTGNHTIPNGGTLTSSFSVPGSGTVVDADVQVDLDHDYDGDLNMTVRTPGDTDSAALVGQCGDSGNNYTNTIFDESSGSQMCDCCGAPFTGTFNPTGNLSDVNGASVNGTWDLLVQDADTHGSTCGAGSDDGTLLNCGDFDSWWLLLRYTAGDGQILYVPDGATSTDFSATCTDAEGDATTLEWDFDSDGSVDATGPTQSNRTFADDSDNTVQARCTDQYGLSSPWESIEIRARAWQ